MKLLSDALTSLTAVQLLQRVSSTVLQISWSKHEVLNDYGYCFPSVDLLVPLMDKMILVRLGENLD